MDPQLLNYYEAIEKASADMLAAARAGHWDEVVRLEGACVLLISQLKTEAMRRDDQADQADPLESAAALRQRLQRSPEEENAAGVKSRIMQRILVNDAEIRQLAEPWLQDLDDTLSGRRQVMH
jgi:flagellar protein FliT